MKVYHKNRPTAEKWIRLRIVLVGAGLALCFGVIIARAVQLQVMQRDLLSERAEGEYKKAQHQTPRRGTIYDQNNEELAVSIDVSSVCAYPKTISAPKNVAKVLSRVLRVEAAPLRAKLTSDRNFVWVKRHATPAEVTAVKALEIEGVDFVSERRRFYPMKTLGGQVIGFCGTEGGGLEGLEYYYDTLLSGQESSWTVFKDALGRSFRVEGDSVPVQDGYDLILTIDKNIQHIAEDALSEAMETFSAKSGMAVVMAPKTGAVLAMANVPQFNPNSFAQYPPSLRRNRAITDAFEPGSTFKIFLAAAALESGSVKANSRFDCEEGSYKVGAHVIHDVHGHGLLSFQDILKYSSNIGAAKIGAKIGSTYYYEKLKAFGFGVATGVDCPGETPGSVLPLDRLTDIDAVAVCFGQGVSVSALQMTAAVGAVANEGIFMKPFFVQAVTDRRGRIVKAFPPTAVRRVISSSSARDLTQMLERVVAKGGTGQNAALRGYRVAGKTGTAQKGDLEKKGYAKDKYTAVFAGFVPARDPAIVILVAVDEPEKGHYGGVVAAPVFKRIAEESLQYLKIPPDLVVPEGEGERHIKALKEESWVG
jgi:cell division protein FtsI (penicillin-binding protein 3)